MKTFVAVFLSVFAAAIFLAACKTSRKGSESAPNRVISRDSNFELRDYPSLTIVETSMDGDSGTSFQRLFRYISGANSDGEKIPMTTPVFMAGEKQSRSMSFVMPANMKSAPGPKDPALRVTTLPAGRFAVFGFSGSRSAESESNALAQLEAWMKKSGLVSSGEPLFGYFDPPWTPPFLRRNEVMLRVDEQKSERRESTQIEKTG
jgi:DNA gyrase inhibitor GyrI